MPDNYANARWLTPREREVARDRVRDNQTVSTDNHWKWSQFWEALRDPQTIFFFVTAVWVICLSVIHLIQHWRVSIQRQYYAFNICQPGQYPTPGHYLCKANNLSSFRVKLYKVLASQPCKQQLFPRVQLQSFSLVLSSFSLILHLITTTFGFFFRS